MWGRPLPHPLAANASRSRIARARSAEPDVLETKLKRRKRHRAVDVRLRPVPLDLIAEDDQRPFLLEPAHELWIHLLARRRAACVAEGVQPLVGLLGLEAREDPGRRRVLHRVVEYVGIDRDTPPRAGDVEPLADQ